MGRDGHEWVGGWLIDCLGAVWLAWGVACMMGFRIYGMKFPAWIPELNCLSTQYLKGRKRRRDDSRLPRLYSCLYYNYFFYMACLG